MNLQDFQNENENNIVDPNLARKMMPGTQGISNPTQKRKVTPQEMGFTHEEPEKIARPEQPILDNMEKAIARKQREAALMSEAIEESDGEGISEEEFQDLLAQAREAENDDNLIPFENEPEEEAKAFETSLPKTNPTRNIMDELEEEDQMDNYDYESEYDPMNYNDRDDYEEAVEEEEDEQVREEPVVEEKPKKEEKKSTPNTVDNPFSSFVSGDIDFDEEDEELEDNIDDTDATKEQQEQLDKLKHLVREKIRPITKQLDISTFSISKKPASTTIATPRDKGEKIADWALMSSRKPIYMRRFTGTEIERLANGGKGRTRLNKALDTWQLIYDHIVDPHKPETLEAWAKTTSFLDIDHIYMAIYRANFEGANYIPYNCTNKDCSDKVFLTDNFDIMDMCKFKDKKAKTLFDEIVGEESTEVSKLYSTEVIPISDNYAFVLREPSIYNIMFESAVLEQEFVDKFGDLISICTYIDGIYQINMERRELNPVNPNFYPNNLKKTIKSRIIKYSKIISTLNSDQYNTLLAYMQKINESGELLTYQLPEVTCPNCGTVIPASPVDAQNMVFTRHQLAALADL